MVNTEKKIYIIFHKLSRKDDIQLRLPILRIAKAVIERTISIKFLTVFLDEHLTWNMMHHIHLLQGKISKKMGLMYNEKIT